MSTEKLEKMNIENYDDTLECSNNNDKIALESSLTSAEFLNKLMKMNISPENIIQKVYELKEQYPSGNFQKVSLTD